MARSRLLICLLFLLRFTVEAQRAASYFAGNKPLLESRVFGQSANFRDEKLERDKSFRYPQPWRLLIAGDDHAYGCGWKSFPPDYTYMNCTAHDEGFRLDFVSQLRELTGAQIETVGSFATPEKGDPKTTRHEARPGLTIAEYSDAMAATVGWARHAPDMVLLMLGSTDVQTKRSSGEMERAYARLLAGLYRELPRARVVVASLLDAGGAGTTPEMRHNRAAFNAALPKVVREARQGMMEVRLFDLGRALPALCRPGVSAVGRSSTGGEGEVPKCSTPEVNPTGRGYKEVAAQLAQAFAEVFSLDGSCRGYPLCQDEDVRKWRNQIDGGLRVVSSAQ